MPWVTGTSDGNHTPIRRCLLLFDRTAFKPATAPKKQRADALRESQQDLQGPCSEAVSLCNFPRRLQKNSPATPILTSAAKAGLISWNLAARLEAAPFQNGLQTAFSTPCEALRHPKSIG